MAIIHPISTVSAKGLDFTIRSPRPEDAEGVLSLAKAVAAEGEFQVSEADEFTMSVDQEKEWIARMNASESELALVADLNGQVIGFIDFHGNSRRRRLAHTGNFGMSVLKEYRGQKIGSCLLEAVLEWARLSRKIEKVSLAVLATNERAIAVYRKLGFIEEGRRIKEIKIGPGHYVDDVLMYKMVK